MMDRLYVVDAAADDDRTARLRIHLYAKTADGDWSASSSAATSSSSS